ncbi:MAG: Nif3-like dinuclear metal center hexameric protein [Bacteroidales bacterium]|nr:Nif3-like dinuclear metal center hexameric protein [Bacteroidales bacterium]
MRINEIIEKLEEKIPLCWQEDFDNCGIQCGDRNAEFTGAMVCFNMSETVLDEAIAQGANLIVSHHPLIFSPLKKIEPVNEIGRVIFKALSHHLTLYSMHTNMDSATFGGNWLFAKKLQLLNIEVLDPKYDVPEPERNTPEFSIYKQGDNLSSVGLGRVGNLPAPMSGVHFVEFVKKQLGVSDLRYSGSLDRQIRRVALCGGAGGSLMKLALAARADVFITGDLRYHDFFIPDDRMLLLDAGHFETEYFIKDILFNELQKIVKDMVYMFPDEKSGIKHY